MATRKLEVPVWRVIVKYLRKLEFRIKFILQISNKTLKTTGLESNTYKGINIVFLSTVPSISHFFLEKIIEN